MATDFQAMVTLAISYFVIELHINVEGCKRILIALDVSYLFFIPLLAPLYIQHFLNNFFSYLQDNPS